MSRPRYSAQTRAQLARAMAPEDREGFLAANPVKSAAAVASGGEAQEHGAALERWLSAQHRAASLAGMANVRKVGPPVVVGSGGVLVGFGGVGPADYLGALRGGRAVAVEAKSREARLSMREIPRHQQDDLARTAHLGGLALLVVELRDTGRIYAAEWGAVPWRYSKALVRGVAETRATVGAEELAGCEVSAREIYLARWL